MGKVTHRENFRVEVDVDPRGGWTQGEAAWERDCEDIAAQIRRHVDGLPRYGNRGVSVAWDVIATCSHGGARWTEDSPDYNGGCCAKDEDAEEDRRARIAARAEGGAR